MKFGKLWSYKSLTTSLISIDIVFLPYDRRIGLEKIIINTGLIKIDEFWIMKAKQPFSIDV